MRPDLSYALRFSATKTYQITCLATSCVYIVKDLSHKWRVLQVWQNRPLKREEIRRTSKLKRNQFPFPPIPRREGVGEGTPSKAAGGGARPCGRHARTRRGRRDDTCRLPPPGPHRHGPAAAAMRLKTPLRASRPPGPPLAKPPSPPTPLIRPPFVS